MKQCDVERLFDSREFKGIGEEILKLLSSYLNDSIEGNVDVIQWQPPLQASHAWNGAMPRQSILNRAELVSKLKDAILSANLRVHHPHNMGHQVAPPLPIAALADLVASLTNQAMAVYEAGPSATLIERQVIKWLTEAVGWNDADGVLTSGGAQANLTALLAARQCMAGCDVWNAGVGAATKPLRLLASEQAHYSVSRAAGIMGLGSKAVLSVATDADGCMDLVDLHHQWQASLERGELPFAVVANAGTTATGSIDPLSEIGTFCQDNHLWFHVDGAHGASALLSDTLKPLLDGIEKADSVVWDGHKLLYMPATVSAVLFRNPQHSYAPFDQEASYLFHGESNADESYNISYRTLECTKRMMGLKLWMAFTCYGADMLGKLVEHVFDSAQELAKIVAASEGFELHMHPQTNIVCFRHCPDMELCSEEMNAHQCRLREALLERGAFHLSQVVIHGDVWLRATVMNPYTKVTDFRALIHTIKQLS